MRQRATTLATGMAVLGTLALAFPSSAQVSAQQAVRNVVARTGPQTEPVDTGNATITECASTVTHLTQAGLVLACYDSGHIPRYRFVVDEQRFPGRSALVIDLLERASAAQASNPRFSASQVLRVRHSDEDPSPQAQTVCSLTLGMDGNPPCRLAVDVAF